MFSVKPIPKVIILTLVKRIIKYISETPDYGILYSFDKNFSLVGYCDADWDGNVEDMKNTHDEYLFMVNNLISWFNKKQKCVSL